MTVPVGNGSGQEKPKACGIIEQPLGGGCEDEPAFDFADQAEPLGAFAQLKDGQRLVLAVGFADPVLGPTQTGRREIRCSGSNPDDAFLIANEYKPLLTCGNVKFAKRR